MSDELKPCPFCGGEAVYERDHTTDRTDSIYCQSCGASILDFNLDGPQGICRAAWNTRADAAPRVKPLVWDNETRYGKRVHAAGDYTIVEHHPDGHVRFSILYRGLRKDKTYYRTIESAKAAAQSDYERRIISALEGQP